MHTEDLKAILGQLVSEIEALYLNQATELVRRKPNATLGDLRDAEKLMKQSNAEYFAKLRKQIEELA